VFNIFSAKAMKNIHPRRPPIEMRDDCSTTGFQDSPRL
jgi:hypothetical protein